jgi:hypothetical protein
MTGGEERIAYAYTFRDVAQRQIANFLRDVSFIFAASHDRFAAPSPAQRHAQ